MRSLRATQKETENIQPFSAFVFYPDTQCILSLTSWSLSALLSSTFLMLIIPRNTLYIFRNQTSWHIKLSIPKQLKRANCTMQFCYSFLEDILRMSVFFVLTCMEKQSNSKFYVIHYLCSCFKDLIRVSCVPGILQFRPYSLS